jgi:hypothetical protein
MGTSRTWAQKALLPLHWAHLGDLELASLSGRGGKVRTNTGTRSPLLDRLQSNSLEAQCSEDWTVDNVAEPGWALE